MHTFCDVNLWVSALGHIGGIQTAADLNTPNPRNLSALKVISKIASGGTPLVMSAYSLVTVSKVAARDTEEFDGLDADSARLSALAIGRLAMASGGFVVSKEETEAGYRAADAALPRERKGDAYGQVDHEDLMVLGACLAAVARLEQAGDPNPQVALVTADRGLLTCAPYLVTRGVAIIQTDAYARVA